MVTDSLYQSYQDPEYKKFTKGLSTTDTLERAGIRLPILKALAKDFQWRDYDIKWHEDVILTGFAIGLSELEPEEKIRELDKLLPYLSTWDMTDSIAPFFKVKKNNKEVFYKYFSSFIC